MTTIARRNHGRNHSYTVDGQKVPGVTTIIGNGLPKPALVAWWKAQRFPALRSGDLTEDQAAAIEVAVATYQGDDHQPGGRNRKMWAQVAEAWPEEPDDVRDAHRKVLIGIITDGASTSSKDLDDEGWTELFETLDMLVAGSHELHQRGSGEWELRAVRGGA